MRGRKQFQSLLLATPVQIRSAYETGCGIAAYYAVADKEWIYDCERLHLAVLEDALHILSTKPSTKAGQLVYAETAAWLDGKIESLPTFSFEDICEHFSLSASWIRNEIAERRYQNAKRAA